MKQLSVNKSYENYAKFDVIWATAIQCGINSVSRMIYEKTTNGYLMLQIEWLHSHWMRTWIWIESRNSEMEMETETEFRDGEWWLNSNHVMCQIARFVKKELCSVHASFLLQRITFFLSKVISSWDKKLDTSKKLKTYGFFTYHFLETDTNVRLWHIFPFCVFLTTSAQHQLVTIFRQKRRLWPRFKEKLCRKQDQDAYLAAFACARRLSKSLATMLSEAQNSSIPWQTQFWILLDTRT